MTQNTFDRVYFYCLPQGSPDKSAYQHSIIVLAEGLQALGIQVYANVDYWQNAPNQEYLLKHDPQVKPSDCSIVVLNDLWFQYGKGIPPELFHRQRQYLTVYLELWGVSNYSLQPEFRQFDLILKAHYNSKLKYPDNCYPWAFGLSERLLKATANIPDWSNRQQNLLVNFRLDHPVRQYICDRLLPKTEPILFTDKTVDCLDTVPDDSYDHLMWQQTGRRHYPAYYQRLKNSSACACFGGVLRYSPSDLTRAVKPWERVLNKLRWGSAKIIRWESWRFWESLAAGCVPFQIDYQKYGAQLPVMPENWQHYIGIDLDNIDRTIERILDEPDILSKISVLGRQWVVEQYSPKPTAQRFLELIAQ